MNWHAQAKIKSIEDKLALTSIEIPKQIADFKSNRFKEMLTYNSSTDQY